MTQKAYILKLLTALENTRSLAPGLKLLVEQDALEEDLVDHLTEIFKQAVEETNNAQEQERLQKWVDFLQTLKLEEAQDNQGTQQDIEKLDLMLNTF